MKDDYYKNLKDIRNRNIAKLAGDVNPKFVDMIRRTFFNGFNREEILEITEYSLKRKKKLLSNIRKKLDVGSPYSKMLKQFVYKSRLDSLLRTEEYSDFLKNCPNNTWQIITDNYGDEINKDI